MPASPHSLKHELLEIHRRTVAHGGSTIHRESTEGRRHYRRRKRKRKRPSTIHPNVSPINSLLAVESRYSHQDGEYTKDYVSLSQQYKQAEKYRPRYQRDRQDPPCVHEQEDHEEVSRICL